MTRVRKGLVRAERRRDRAHSPAELQVVEPTLRGHYLSAYRDFGDVTVTQ